MSEEHKPLHALSVETGTVKYWVGRNGCCVVSNKPACRSTKQTDTARAMCNGADEWLYYGGFLICESVPNSDAERIAAALNFCEGVPTEFLQRWKYQNLIATLDPTEKIPF